MNLDVRKPLALIITDLIHQGYIVSFRRQFHDDLLVRVETDVFTGIKAPLEGVIPEPRRLACSTLILGSRLYEVRFADSSIKNAIKECCEAIEIELAKENNNHEQ